MRALLVSFLVAVALSDTADAFNVFSPRRSLSKRSIARPLATEEEIEKVGGSGINFT
jgi:hypothetical protein